MSRTLYVVAMKGEYSVFLAKAFWDKASAESYEREHAAADNYYDYETLDVEVPEAPSVELKAPSADSASFKQETAPFLNGEDAEQDLGNTPSRKN